MQFALIRKYHRSFKFVLIGIVLFVLMDLIFPIPDNKEFSKEIRSDDGTLLTAYLTKDDKWRLRTNLKDVSPELIKAILEKEDKWFYWHPGVNPYSIIRTLIRNIASGDVEAGASTITMQVARMLEPKRRNYFNKLTEIFRALQLEIKYSKEEILELYLSLLPFGGNIEGVKSASYIYFNRPPDKLSLAQSIMLAVIPNDPNNLRLDRSNNTIENKRNIWVRKFKSERVFSISDLNDALQEPVEKNRFPIPVLAPHFCYYVKENFRGDILNTTLKLSSQQIAENILLRHVKKVYYKGISNGAVIVIDNKTSSVVAYCGSADYNDAGSFGQVNGITAIRSPGSTLKAALYAYAFDEGLLTPKKMIADIPSDFHGYQPENYDLKFYGNVSAEFALVNSLNIPAVKLLEEIRTSNFISFLENCGFDQIKKQKNKLGLSLILGGCGTNLQQIAQLFTAFSRKGKYFSLNFLKSENEFYHKQLFSESSAYLIAKILSGIDRTDIADLSNYSKLPKFAWKTGTSYGKRDAWAIGFNPNYTIGVWMGNFNGVGSPSLSGAETAVPVLFDLFNAIDYNSDVKWFSEPKELYKRNVCVECGLIPSQYCSDITTDFAIKKHTNNNVCDIHKPIYVSNDERIQYCTGCLPSSGFKKVVYPVYDPELSFWIVQNKSNNKTPPEHNPLCESKFTSEGPKILSPTEDYEYLLEKNSEQEIMLLAVSDSRVKKLYWYVNDMFIRKCQPGEKVFIKPVKKELKITCLDDLGRDKTINISIKYY